ncbi:hypothetical protein OQA88_2428 [Cercophora sp. LCS_1]
MATTPSSLEDETNSIVLADLDWTPSDFDDDASFEVESEDGSGLGGFETSGSQSSKSTLEKGVRKHRFHHGRRYHHYRSGTYPLPNDQLEQDREDMKHVMMLDLTDGKYFLAPIQKPQSVIDLGTGTGLWCIEVGEMLPDAKVIGVDLSPIQPRWTPPNVNFNVDDIEDEWLYGTKFDLVHARHVFPFIKDTRGVTEKAFSNLVSGGWFEVQDLGLAALCDDGTVPEDFGIAKFLNVTTEAWKQLGCDIRIGPKLEGILQEAGFINVNCTTYKVPIGGWPADRKLQSLGMHMRFALDMVVPPMCTTLGTVLGWSAAEKDAFCLKSRQSLEDTSAHAYLYCYIVHGQKP